MCGIIMGMAGEQLLYRSNALASGYGDRDIQKMHKEGILDRVRPGIYIQSADRVAHADRSDQHLLAVHAAAAKQQSPAVVSHVSAAVLHGLPVWDLPLNRVHMTKPVVSGGHTSKHRHLHSAPLPEEHVTEVDGIRVTTPARTIADLACTSDHQRAVAVGDSALNNALTSIDEIISATDVLLRKKGIRKARAAIGFMDYRSESPAESLSRIIMRREGLPTPTLQQVIRSDGVFLGRPDFLFDEYGIVGECDGRVKYLGRDADRDYEDERTPSDVVWEEKKREDRLRAAGLEVFRWTWADLFEPGTLASKFARAVRLRHGRPAPAIDPPRPDDAYVPRDRRRSKPGGVEF